MVHLVLVILLSTAFSLMMKHAHARGYGVFAVGCVNYVVAGAIAGIGWLPQLSEAFSSRALLLGCAGGVMYVLCYLFIMVMLERQGISVATALTRLAIVVPVLASILLWNEKPTVLQVLGLGATFVAIMLFDLGSGSKMPSGFWRVIWPLVGCFATAGCSRLCQKAFRQLCARSDRPLFLASWFVCAGVVSLVTLAVRRERPSMRDAAFGSILGVINIVALHCAVIALETVPAVVYFPATAAGGLVLVVTLAAWAWGEDLSVRTKCGIALACCALILVNLQPEGLRAPAPRLPSGSASSP